MEASINPANISKRKSTKTSLSSYRYLHMIPHRPSSSIPSLFSVRRVARRMIAISVPTPDKPIPSPIKGLPRNGVYGIQACITARHPKIICRDTVVLATVYESRNVGASDIIGAITLICQHLTVRTSLGFWTYTIGIAHLEKNIWISQRCVKFSGRSNLPRIPLYYHKQLSHSSRLRQAYCTSHLSWTTFAQLCVGRCSLVEKRWGYRRRWAGTSRRMLCRSQWR